jgi:mono/diheme cytochrome c family protein
VPGPPINSRARFGVLAIALTGLIGLAGCDVSEDADVDRGRELFQGKCGTCHALAQAGTDATIGPDLDAAFARARADGMDNDTIEGVVQKQIAHPRDPDAPEGSPEYTRVYMPPDIVEGQDSEDVATYIASVAGVPGAKPPPLGTPEEVFTEECGICHALSQAGTAGTAGPDLDEALAGKSADYIRTQIVDPDSQIAPGFDAGVMPDDFEEQLGADRVDKLVDWLLKNLGGGAG